jgi:hypothetical protein
MSRIIKWLLFMFLLSAFCSRSGRAQTINAPTCSASDVQTALNSVKADGTTVVIPAGNCTWTNAVSYNQVFSTTIQGQSTTAGSCAPGGSCTATDSTVITDNLTRPVGCGTGDGSAFVLNTAATKTLRLTGITMRYSSNATCVGSVAISGSGHQTRIDHNHFNGVSYVAVGTYGFTWGVIDHNLFDLPNGTWNAIKFHEDHWNNGDSIGAGDASWADTTTFGSNRAIYVENNFFSIGPGAAGYADDCTQGGRFVWRHNVMTNAELQTHPTGGGQRHRGCRSAEIYSNAFTGTGGAGADFIGYFFSSGTALIWGNTINSGYSHFVVQYSMRRLGQSGGGTYNQSPTPSGWGYCGTSFNGTGSGWDQNTNASTGYRCLDQPGTGVGDLLANDFPNAINTVTNSISWPHQALEPVYEWLNASAAQFYWSSAISPSAFVANSDYYNYTASFNGTSGTGSGLLSARPSTCTPRVGYWATDTQTLYQCTATNTWTAYYTPYTYPHPLTLGSGTAPAPPSGLAAIVN